MNWVNSTRNNYSNFSTQQPAYSNDHKYSYPASTQPKLNYIQLDSPTYKYSGNVFSNYGAQKGYSTPSSLFKPSYMTQPVKSGFMSNPEINVGMNTNYRTDSSNIQYYYKAPIKYQYKPNVISSYPNPVYSQPLRPNKISAPRYHHKPLHTNLTYVGHERFVKCIDNFMSGIEFVSKVTENSFLFRETTDQRYSGPSTYYIGIKTSFEYRVEGMYKLYKEELNNSVVFNELLGVIPRFQGCVILSYLDNRKIYSKGLKDNVMFIYEMVPLWLDVIKENSLEMTDLNLSEMVHQLYWFFKRIFKSRLFARYFTSRDIGIKFVNDVHLNMSLSTNVYSRSNVMYLFRHMENLSSKCDYAKDSQFQSLLQRYLKDKHSSFQHVGESDIEICQQINVFNLLLLLEVSLFRSSGLEVDKNIIFKGCLDETEDIGFKCPPSILAVLGKNKFKLQVRNDQMTQMFYMGLLNIRTNLLNYSTRSTISWMGYFLDELLRVFRLHMVGRLNTANETNYVKQIKVNMEGQRKVIQKIQDLRKLAQNPNLYEEQMSRIKGVINRLSFLKHVAKDKEEGISEDYQNMPIKTIKDKMSTGLPRDSSRAHQDGLKMIYSEERPFKNKKQFLHNVDDFMNKRNANQEIDGIILDDPYVSKSEISRIQKREQEMNASVESSEQTKIISSGLTNKQILLEKSEIRQSQVISRDQEPSHQSADSQTQANLTIMPLKQDMETIDHEDGVEMALDTSQTRIVEPDEIETLSEKDDLIIDQRVNETLDQINTADISDHQKIGAIIDKDISELENVITLIDDSLNKQPEKNQSTVTTKTEAADKMNTSVEFENGEAMKFINRIDSDGIEYLSMEINFNMINPKDFGFEDYEQKDQAELQQKIQEHFINALQSDEEMQKLGLKIYDLI